MAKVFKIAGISLAVAAVVLCAAGYFYWQHLKGTPQYSLALIVDAAKRDDQAELDSLVDVNAITDNFTPQVTAKAAEMYGKGLPPAVIARLKLIAIPMLPAVKDRARAELPRLIRERMEKFGSVPFPLIALGADHYLSTKVEGDVAVVESTIPDSPLKLKMTRVGTRWKVTAFEDDALAAEIARRIGEELVAIASATEIGPKQKSFDGVDLDDLLRMAGEALQ
ncbi:MAG: hypothetical protein UZ17_ACD001000201 [Acidobacteria bacterium OLB17]|nr:MAG: hypothetical protein UZ17_ACD001000201 [Acidobacteria bacterium OLB17]MCZ2389674.1 DUF2939 domain-containing protein [Acidobacteriota bacterium]